MTGLARTLGQTENVVGLIGNLRSAEGGLPGTPLRGFPGMCRQRDVAAEASAVISACTARSSAWSTCDWVS